MKDIEIDADLLAKLEALPGKMTARKRLPTPKELKILRCFWTVKRQTDVSALMGVHENTCRKWYRDYIEKE